MTDDEKAIEILSWRNDDAVFETKERSIAISSATARTSIITKHHQRSSIASQWKASMVTWYLEAFDAKVLRAFKTKDDVWFFPGN